MPTEQRILVNDKIDYHSIAKKYPWIAQKDQQMILSPDCDGFLCGLLLSTYLNWKVVGYYDGKIAILKKGTKTKKCVFLDMDIFRKNIRSIGHHMVLYNKNSVPPNWNNYSNCIQLNNLRNFDYRHDFQRKYPFGTIHFLLGLLQSQNIIKSLPSTAMYPLLFADGLWTVFFDYTENSLDWIDYLRINESTHILNSIFCGNHSFYQVMQGINTFLRVRDSFNAIGTYTNGTFVSRAVRRSGHNLRISNQNGYPINLVQNGHLYNIHTSELKRVLGFINRLAKDTEWSYIPSHWTWAGFELYKFSKADFSNNKIKLNDANFQNIIRQNPISWAMGGQSNMEYTLETPDKLP